MTDSLTIPTGNSRTSDAFSGGADAGAYIELLKPRVMSLVVFTAFVGLMAAPGSMHPVLGFAAVLLIAIGAGASGALNMWYDRDIDLLMDRTKSRPIPSGRISGGDALGFGLGLSVFSVVLLGLIANMTAALLLALTIFFYAVVYTMWLKRRTVQNIVIGGAAGAFPPVIGWAAVTDSVTLEALSLFAIIFLWTPPHFWALALFKSVKDDYGRAVVPMLPVVAGEKVTRRQILLYSVALLPAGLSPYLMGFAGDIYGIVSSALGLAFLWLAIETWRGRVGAEKKLFFYSIFYLFALFAVIGIERVAGVLSL